jgi:hypothetical protein
MGLTQTAHLCSHSLLLRINLQGGLQGNTLCFVGAFSPGCSDTAAAVYAGHLLSRLLRKDLTKDIDNRPLARLSCHKTLGFTQSELE